VKGTDTIIAKGGHMDNYLEKVLHLMEVLAFEPGKVSTVHVYHDSMCPAIRHKNPGPCTCDPDIVLKELNVD
jgi:hypothetical protein